MYHLRAFELLYALCYISVVGFFLLGVGIGIPYITLEQLELCFYLFHVCTCDPAIE